MILTTDRLTLRRPEARDMEAITAFYMSERSAMTGGHLPRTAAWRAAAFVLGHWEARGFGLWAVTLTGEDKILGLVGPFYPEGWPEREIGWLMFEGSEGKGIAFEAAQAAIADARRRLGFTEIVHYIRHGNARSVALAERLGARLDPAAEQPLKDRPCLIYRQPAEDAA
jgi:RimJ/RimL family protein N-acetyltransferase